MPRANPAGTPLPAQDSASPVRHLSRTDSAPHARQCCPTHALADLAPADLAALDRWCARALHDPDAEPRDGDEAAAVSRYYALLAERARDWWR